MAKTKWKIDPSHSSIDFSIRHMMISRVRGSFHKFDATVEADPEDLTTANIEFTIDVSSIDTRNEDRDNHLRSADFFDVEKYPHIMFKSTNITKTGDNEYDVTGDLTMHGTTRSETFSVTYEGQSKDPMSGNIKAGFSGKAKIKRHDYGLTWNVALETGGVVAGENVDVSFEIQATKEE